MIRYKIKVDESLDGTYYYPCVKEGLFSSYDWLMTEANNVDEIDEYGVRLSDYEVYYKDREMAIAVIKKYLKQKEQAKIKTSSIGYKELRGEIEGLIKD